MVAAADKARQAMADHDLVIEVLDARCPGASGNPTIDRMRLHRQRPLLKVLNKTDIADPAITAAWLAYFNAQKNTHAIALSCKKPGEAAKVLAAARKLAPHRNDNLKPLRMLIMGVPNVGKSTLINALLKRKVAKTGDEPAITKILHRYDLTSDMQLTDTPGLMWPRITQPSDGLMLAASHVIGANAYIDSEVAIYLADLLLELYPQAVATRYGISPELIAQATAAREAAAAAETSKTVSAHGEQAPAQFEAGTDAGNEGHTLGAAEATADDTGLASGTGGRDDAEATHGFDGVALIESIAAKRGYRLKGSHVDFDKASLALLADYRGGALGRISLETPKSRDALLARAKHTEAAQQAAEEAAAQPAAGSQA